MYTREKLIELCKSAVVPFDNWHDPYSYEAQTEVAQTYMALTANCEYELDLTSEYYIHIKFPDVTGMLDRGQWLEIGSLDEYREEYPGYEMNDAGHTWSGYMRCTIPTQKAIDEANGEDWNN